MPSIFYTIYIFRKEKSNGSSTDENFDSRGNI